MGKKGAKLQVDISPRYMESSIIQQCLNIILNHLIHLQLLKSDLFQLSHMFLNQLII